MSGMRCGDAGNGSEVGTAGGRVLGVHVQACVSADRVHREQLCLSPLPASGKCSLTIRRPLMASHER